MILIPTVGMAIVTTRAGIHLWDERDTATTISADAGRMDELMTASNAVRNESVRALALANAAEMGIDPAQLLPLYGIDFTAELVDARAAVDADRVLRTEPTLRFGLLALRAERAAIDAGTLSPEDAGETFDAISGAIRELWQAARRDLEGAIDVGSIDGRVLHRVEVLRASYDAFVAGDRRIGYAIELGGAEPGASVRNLIEANAQLDAAMAAFEHRVSDRAQVALGAFAGDPAVHRLDHVVDSLIADGLAGTVSTLAADPVAYGAAFVDSATWIDRSARVVAAASADLGAIAAAESAAQTAGFWSMMTTAGVVLVLSMVAVALFSRSFTRPLDRIAVVVQAVRDGAFDIPRVLLHGPRELSDTVDAVNDMAASIDQSSHDGITGLLNRRAALDAMGRDLARARRDGERVVAIYLDLDGLKGINDVHGHQAGDRALALVADALRHTCRESDVVARLGGDEFLIAGVVQGGTGVDTAYADRIREAVGQQVLWCDDAPIPLRCSVGVAMNEPGSVDVDALLAAADSAMYLMKLAGRAI